MLADMSMPEYNPTVLNPSKEEVEEALRQIAAHSAEPELRFKRWCVGCHNVLPDDSCIACENCGCKNELAWARRCAESI